VANHQSFLDPPLVGTSSPRPLHYLARDTLFEIPIVGWVIARVQAFPVRREGLDRASLKRALAILRGGGALLVFPEGTRSPDGHPRRPKSGFVWLARKAQVPILPVRLEGAFEAWPRKRRFPNPRPIRVVFGAPLDSDGPEERLVEGLVRFWGDR
jgi:1-acyl-sn-glycerol-3-phosphate acyltransferase